MKKLSRIKWNLENLMIPMTLIVISFYDFNRGIDLTDAGYSMHYFQFFEEYSGVDIIPMFWSMFLGNVFTKMPGGDTWSGLSFYCTIVIMLSAVTGYFFCKKYMNYMLVALAEVMAIFMCWCPNVVLYDYLSFFILQVSIILIFRAIEKERNVCYVIAGVLLGLNVFVRISNLTHCVAIVLVWVAGWKKEKRFRKVLEETIICAISYGVGVLFSLIVIIQRYGYSELKLAIYELAQMSQEQENYGIMYMATATVLELLKYWKYVMLLLAVLILFSVVVNRFAVKKIRTIIKAILSMVVISMFFYWKEKEQLFSFEYELLDAIVGLAAIFLLSGLIASIWNLFTASESSEKLLALTFIGVFYVTPLGSNTHIYLSILNMFLTIPLGIYQMKLFGKNISSLDEKKGMWKYLGENYKVMIGTVGVIMAFQTTLFGINYIYKDVNEYVIYSDGILKGAISSETRAGELLDLLSYFEYENLNGNYGIAYCAAPSLSYILELKPVMSSPWPDWYTFSYDSFFRGMLFAEQLVERGEAPVLIVDTVRYYCIEGKEEELKDIYIPDWGEVKGDKFFRLERFIYDNMYECTYRTANYAVYRKI